jgi:ABC-type multidrug transport system fused ATPase/permease subunit
MFSYIKKINLLLNRRDKLFLYFLVLFALVMSVIETISVSIIMPFVTFASNFETIHSNKYSSYIYKLFDFSDNVSFILAFTVVLVFFYIFRVFLNIIFAYLSAKFGALRYSFIVCRLFENYLGRNYQDYIKNNSSVLNKTIISESENFSAIIACSLMIFSEAFIIIFIYSMLIWANWKITLALTILLSVQFLFIVKPISRMIKNLGGKRAEYQKNFYEILNSTFGNFKLIKLSGSNNILNREFKDIISKYSKIGITFATSNNLPRLLLEASSFIIVVTIVAYLVYIYNSDVSGVTAIISLFVLGMYRLMPAINRVITNYNEIMFRHRAVDIVYDDFNYKVEDLKDDLIEFNSTITIKNLKFEYIKDKIILKNLNFVINKGQRVAFIGDSGSGKSTLIDIIIGLFKPLSGAVLVDGVDINDNNIKQWRNKIGYIPQSIYLFDGTVAQNIVLGTEPDIDKIKNCLQKANILDFLEKHHKGINTQVGEGGIMLSGGQKQRIAIARALYNDPEILVLDEATSALDSGMEDKIMEEIYSIGKDKTLIIIAHRLSTIKNCDTIFKLTNGHIDTVSRSTIF